MEVRRVFSEWQYSSGKNPGWQEILNAPPLFQIFLLTGSGHPLSEGSSVVE